MNRTMRYAFIACRTLLLRGRIPLFACLLTTMLLATEASAAPKVILISLDGARPWLVQSVPGPWRAQPARRARALAKPGDHSPSQHYRLPVAHRSWPHRHCHWLDGGGKRYHRQYVPLDRQPVHFEHQWLCCPDWRLPGRPPW